MRRRFIHAAVFLALAGLLAALPALGQGVQRGTLIGTAKDVGGDPIPGVTVTVTSPALQGSRSAVTNLNGDYSIPGLPGGEYTVRFELEGMQTLERTATLEIGRSARADATMAISTVDEVIVVTGESANALETPTLGANYGEELVDSLAIPRDLDGIAELAPGVTANTPLSGQVAISGGMAYDNSFLLDGVDINDNIFGDPDLLFIEDAIDEVQVLVSSISAEFGRFSGGVVNAVTRSGGNEFHGGLRADWSNPSWRDETPFEEEQGVDREDIDNRVDTATLGGYIVKDRLWFFAAGRDTESTDQILLQQTGIPFSQLDENTRLQGKLTGSFTDSHRLSLAYTDNERNVRQLASIAAGSTLDTVIEPSFPNDLIVGRYDGVLSPSVFVEARYSEKNFRFEDFGGTSTDIRDSPFRCWNIDPCQYNAPLFDANDPEDRNNEQLAASLNWFLSSERAGTHDFKVGFERFENIRTGGNSNSATDWVFFHDFKLDANGLPILDANGKAIPVFTSFFDSSLFGLGVFFESFRGSEVSITTDSFYVNDRWDLNDHWSFNLGVRYETNDSDATTGRPPIDTDNIVPRVSAVYDVGGDGKYRIEASYAEYVGSYNMSLFTQTTNTGNASYVYGPYIGPSGEGIDFAPGFDPDNYFFVAGNIPTLNIFFDEDLSAPTNEELALSFGYQLPKGGYVKASWVDRELTDVVEDFVLIENGASTGEIQGVPVTLDNIVYRNSNEAFRKYEAIVLQSQYQVTRNFSLQGHWTWQLENDGNYEGEGGQSIGPGLVGVGNYPEVLVPERNFPAGRLNEFQEHVVRLWGRYNLDFGRAGALGMSLLYNYNSPLTYSLSSTFGLTAQQRALDPGYVGLPTSQSLFFGERGSEEFEDYDSVDLALRYSIPIWKDLDFWVKGEVRNVFNDQTLAVWNTSIVPITDGPVDELGLPTTFRFGDSFGRPLSDASFNTPREYRFAAGFRF